MDSRELDLPPATERSRVFEGDVNGRPLASVCIVSYRAPELLKRCLESVYRSIRSESVEVIVADNSCHPQCVEMVQQDFPWVRCIQLERNLGFAKAMNVALRNVRSDYVLVLNPDTELHEGAFWVAYRRLVSDESVGVVGGRLFTANGGTDWASRRNFPMPRDFLFRTMRLDALFPRSRIIARYAMTYIPYDRSSEVECISGAFMFARMEAVRVIGGLDERFFMYGEDLDWSYRFHRSRWTVFYDATVHVTHVKRGCARSRPARMRIEYYRSLFKLYHKHYQAPVREQLAVFTLCSAAAIAAAATAWVRSATQHWLEAISLYGNRLRSRSRVRAQCPDN